MRKIVVILFFLVTMCVGAYAFNLTIIAYDINTHLQIPAMIYIDGIPTGHTAPYTFVGYGPGDYSCQLAGYIDWLPLSLNIVNVLASISYPFYGVPDNGNVPVELTSFSAILTADLFVQLAWTTQSETNHAGFNVLRGTDDILETATKVNFGLISEGTQIGSQTNYLFTDEETDAGAIYFYWLESVALDGSSEYYGPMSIYINGNPEDTWTPEIPAYTELLSAYPNPFNPSTNLQYSVKNPGVVRIDVFNTKGQLIRRFEKNHGQPGHYTILWDGKDAYGKSVTSGIYLYRMTAGTYSAVKKLVLSK